MQLPDQIWLLLFLLGVEVNAPVCNVSETTRRYLKTMNIHIIMSLCNFCDYFVIIISHSYVASMRGQKKMLNLLWICEFRFKCSMSSLAVVFFLRPVSLGHNWHFVSWKLSANLLHCFTANGKPNYDIRVNSITPPLGWRKNAHVVFYPHVPWAPLHPTISPSLKRKRICYSFILFKVLCHFPMVHRNIITQTSLHLNIHSLLRMLQYLWPASEGICFFRCVISNRISDYRHLWRNRNLIKVCFINYLIDFMHGIHELHTCSRTRLFFPERLFFYPSQYRSSAPILWKYRMPLSWRDNDDSKHDSRSIYQTQAPDNHLYENT